MSGVLRVLLATLALSLAALPALAADESEANSWEKFQDKSRAAKKRLDEATLRRPGSVGVSAFYTPFSLPFPSTWGLDLYYIVSPKWTWSLEYRSATYNIGIGPVEFADVKERDYGLHGRYYHNASSFNTLWGVGLQKRSIHVAQDLLEIYTGDYSLAVSETSTFYGIFGIGNHYRFGNWNFDVDWFTLSIPLTAETDKSATRYTTTDQGRQNAKRTERFMKYFPSMTAFKMMIGMSW